MNPLQRTPPTMILTLALLAWPASLPPAAQEPAAPAGGVESCAARGFLPAILAGDAGAELRRMAELAGAAPVRPGVALRPSSQRRDGICPSAMTAFRLETSPQAAASPGGGALAFRPLPVALRTELNSAYPVDRNNGVLWSGRGVSSAIQAGIELHWGPVSAAFAPTIVYQQNRGFETVESNLPGASRYAYPWHGLMIDWPQRFGDRPFWTTDPGQSYVRVDLFGFKAGVSTENLWWGPAQRYPIIMSSTAPGFPHVFAGTSRPVDVGIGRLEAELFWGELGESRYFDEDAENDRRLIGGVILDFEPRWVPGLYLGYTRAYLNTIPPEGLPLDEYLGFIDLPVSIETGNRPGNGLGSIFARWVLPESGFEVYAEWAREDYTWNLTDFLKEPDHSQAYTLGLQKVWSQPERWIRFTAELTHLQQSITFRSHRPGVTYYIHGAVKQGYTHRGQLLGAFIGPGSDAQYLAVDVLRPRSSLGATIERIRRDDDAYYQVRAQNYGFHGHDVELTLGLRGSVHVRAPSALHLRWRAAYSRRENRNFLGLDGNNWDFRKDGNWNAELAAIWVPHWPRRP